MDYEIDMDAVDPVVVSKVVLLVCEAMLAHVHHQFGRNIACAATRTLLTIGNTDSHSFIFIQTGCCVPA